MTIDITKPLELADGTPVVLSSKNSNIGISINVDVNGSLRSFDAKTGKHCTAMLPNLRNVAEEASPPYIDHTKPMLLEDGTPVEFLCFVDDDENSNWMNCWVGSESSTSRDNRTFNRRLGYTMSAHMPYLRIASYTRTNGVKAVYDPITQGTHISVPAPGSVEIEMETAMQREAEVAHPAYGLF